MLQHNLRESPKNRSRKKQESTIEAPTKTESSVVTKTEGSVVTKRSIWAIILGIHNAINEVRPNIGMPINTHF